MTSTIPRQHKALLDNFRSSIRIDVVFRGLFLSFGHVYIFSQPETFFYAISGALTVPFSSTLAPPLEKRSDAHRRSCSPILHAFIQATLLQSTENT